MSSQHSDLDEFSIDTIDKIMRLEKTKIKLKNKNTRTNNLSYITIYMEKLKKNFLKKF